MKLKKYNDSTFSAMRLIMIFALMFISKGFANNTDPIPPGSPSQLNGDEIVVGASLYAIDQEIGKANTITVNSNTNIVLAVDSNIPTSNFKYQVKLNVSPIDENGDLGAPYLVTLSVNYNKNGDIGNYTDLELHEMIGSHGADISIEEIATEDTETGEIFNSTPQNVSLKTVHKADHYYQLSSSIINPSHDVASQAGTLKIKWNQILGAKEYDLEWTWIDNYDEPAGNGTFQPIDAIDIPLTNRDFELNSTRIQVNATPDLSNELFYNIPLIYSRGWLIYRVRAVGRFIDNPNDLTVPYYGNWSSSATTKENVSDWDAYQILTPHENKKNWQFQASYAEDGKKKEVVSYFDGTLRNRQTVTKINSDDNAIVGEVIYDNQGRPGIEVLPVPAGDNKIKYYNNFNLNTNDEPKKYSHLDFDWDNPDPDSSCDIIVGKMADATGASKYYSPNNTLTNTYQDYVPDAKLFPFSQIEYTPDNTGRIRRKSGVGPDHQLGTDSEMKYFYSQPTSSFELNRLFGNQVGRLNHYKKNVVVDPNTQTSISYIDPQGRTIATALAGGNPRAPLQGGPPPPYDLNILEGLEDEKNDDLHDEIKVNLLENNEKYATTRFDLLEDGKQVQKQITSVQNATDYDFEYTLTNDKKYLFNEGCPLEFPYKYDLEIKFLDDCGKNLLGGDKVTETAIENYDSSTINLSAFTNVGEYSLVKNLIVNQDSVEQHWKAFLENAFENPDDKCILTEEDFKLVQFDCTTLDCDIVALGESQFIKYELENRENYSDITFSIASGEVVFDDSGLDSNTIIEINASITGLEDSFPIVLKFCENKTFCNSNKEILLADVSPLGQYGETVSDDDDDDDDNDFLLSVFNTENKLYNTNDGSSVNNNWRNPVGAYKDSDGRTKSKLKVKLVSGTPGSNTDIAVWNPEILDSVEPKFLPLTGEYEILPQELALVKDFITAWADNPYWANALLPYHPEYCYFEYTKAVCEEKEPILDLGELSSVEFDQYLNSVQKYADATGLIGSTRFTRLMDLDPFFKNVFTDSENTNVKDLRRAIMSEALSANYEGLANDIPTPFGMMAYSYAVVSQGSLMNTTTIQTIPTTATGIMNKVNNSLTPEKQDQFWIQYVNNYLGLKNRIYDVFINIHAIKKGCYNSCLNGDVITQGTIDTIKDEYGVDVNINTNRSFAAPILNYLQASFNGGTVLSAISSMATNQTGTSLCSNSDYEGKIKRFPGSSFLFTPDILDGGPLDDTDDDYYNLTGKCKIQSDLQIFLNGFFADRTNFSQLNSNSEDPFTGVYFTIDLFTAFGGVDGETPTVQSMVSGDLLTITFGGIANPSCSNGQNIKLKAPTGLSWSNYGNSATNWNFVGNNFGLSEVYYNDQIDNGDNRYHYEMLATIEVGGNIIEKVVKGDTCAKLDDCLDCDSSCRAQIDIPLLESAFLELYQYVFNNNLHKATTPQPLPLSNTLKTFFVDNFEPRLRRPITLDDVNNAELINLTTCENCPIPNKKLNTVIKLGEDHYVVLSEDVIERFFQFEDVTSINSFKLAPLPVELGFGYTSFVNDLPTRFSLIPHSEIDDITGTCYERVNCKTQFYMKIIVRCDDNNPSFTNDILTVEEELVTTFPKATKLPNRANISNFNDPEILANSNNVNFVNQLLTNDCENRAFDLIRQYYEANLRFLLNGIIDYNTSNNKINISNELSTQEYTYFLKEFFRKVFYFEGYIQTEGEFDPNQLIYNKKTPSVSPFGTFPGLEFPEIGASLLLGNNSFDFETISSIDSLTFEPRGSNNNDTYVFSTIAEIIYTVSGSSFTKTWPFLFKNKLWNRADNSIRFYCEPTNTTGECPCVVQTVAPLSCNDKWTAFKDGLELVLETDPETDEDFYKSNRIEGLEYEASYFSEEYFCGMNFGYITDNYLYYLDKIQEAPFNVTDVSHPLYMDIAVFGNTGLNYGFNDSNTVVDAYLETVNVTTEVADPNDGNIEDVIKIDISWFKFVNGENFPAEVGGWIAANRPCLPATMIPEINIDIDEPIDPCNEIIDSIATAYAQQSYLDYLKQLKAQFVEGYVNGAIASAQETFSMEYRDKEYQYTLYYYDQAGNLIQTVPPEGTKRLGDDLDKNEKLALNDQINADVNGTNTQLVPEHDMKTNYRYNSLNQLVWQKTPDGGETRFAYDKLGRIIASQNAKQAESYFPENVDTSGPRPVPYERFSYTNYDELGRIIEAGEFNDIVTINYKISDEGKLTKENKEINGFEFTTTPESTAFKKEVTLTQYDKLYSTAIEALFESYSNTSNRNRVTAVIYRDLIDKNRRISSNTIYYDYDIHGNVKEIITENNDSNLRSIQQTFKKVKYEYDLISGNVNQVTYQKDKKDQFIHRYEYDADNRIVSVQTSSDGLIWETDANYQYYEHGPLARVLIGDKKVQGVDYAYTLQGWLKGVNGEILSSGADIGEDGLNINENTTANDAFAYSLSYYNEDYTPRKAVNSPFRNGDALYETQHYGLYNGNIRGMTTALMDTNEKPINKSYNNYKYDQLNRIVGMESYETDDFTSSNASGDLVSTSYAYDRNGNLDKLVRSARLENGTVAPMDNLSYEYNLINGERSNQLKIVKDNGTDPDLFDNDIETHDENYEYDAIGQLTKDIDEGIEKIDWRVDGKVSKITKQDDLEISFTYDGLGNRLSKNVFKADGAGKIDKTTYYSRDAQGNVLSVYNLNDDRDGDSTPSTLDIDIDLQNGTITTPTPGELYRAQNSITVAGGLNSYTVEPEGNLELEAGNVITLKPGFTAKEGSNFFEARIREIGAPTDLTYTLAEQHIYGSSRLGLQQPNLLLENVPGLVSNNKYERVVGDKRYELSNHLGNVLTVISDRKLYDSSGFLPFFTPDVLAYNDYYPFGMLLPNRHGSDDSYRYGFQGQEKDDEIKGEGNSLNYKFRMHDPRVGRFFAIDPLSPQYAHYTPYSFSGNKVIAWRELEGLEEDNTNDEIPEEDANWFVKGMATIFVKIVNTGNNFQDTDLGYTINALSGKEYVNPDRLSTEETISRGFNGFVNMTDVAALPLVAIPMSKPRVGFTKTKHKKDIPSIKVANTKTVDNVTSSKVKLKLPKIEVPEKPLTNSNVALVTTNKLHGTGPAKGTIEISNMAKSIKKLLSQKKEETFDFVFDPKSKRLLVSQSNSPNAGGHTRLYNALGIKQNEALGGRIKIRSDGIISTSEWSGHTGQNWNIIKDARKSFSNFMSEMLKETPRMHSPGAVQPQ